MIVFVYGIIDYILQITCGKTMDRIVPGINSHNLKTQNLNKYHTVYYKFPCTSWLNKSPQIVGLQLFHWARSCTISLSFWAKQMSECRNPTHAMSLFTQSDYTQSQRTLPDKIINMAQIYARWFPKDDSRPKGETVIIGRRRGHETAKHDTIFS